VLKHLPQRIARRVLDPLGLELSRKSTRDGFAIQQRLAGADARVVFDVGAHVGQTYRRYRTLFPSAQIHAFEPFPESFAALRNACAQDGAARANQIALSENDQPLVLHINKRSDTNSSLPLDDRAGQFWGDAVSSEGRTVEVPSITLDAYCEQNAIERIDLLKLDVQGGELRVLRGARRMLQAQRVRLVFTELLFAPTYRGQPSINAYFELLDGYGYELFDMLNLTRSGDRLIQSDVLFRPKELTTPR